MPSPHGLQPPRPRSLARRLALNEVVYLEPKTENPEAGTPTPLVYIYGLAKIQKFHLRTVAYWVRLTWLP
jgi:hypothetical protein